MRITIHFVFFVMFASLSTIVLSMEPPQRPPHRVESGSFQFTPSSKALELVHAARTMPLKLAQQLQNSGGCFDRLMCSFVIFWHNYPLHGLRNLRELLKDIDADPSPVQALLTLVGDEDERARLCETLFFDTVGRYLVRFALLEFFVSNGYDLNRRNSQQRGRTAIFLACHIRTLNYLLEHGALIDAVDDDGRTVLDCAIENTNSNFIAYLQSRGARARATPPYMLQFLQNYLQPPQDTGPLYVSSPTPPASEHDGGRMSVYIGINPSTISAPQCARMLGFTPMQPMLEMEQPLEFVPPQEGLQVPSPAEGVRLDFGDHFGLPVDTQRVTLTLRSEENFQQPARVTFTSRNPPRPEEELLRRARLFYGVTENPAGLNENINPGIGLPSTSTLPVVFSPDESYLAVAGVNSDKITISKIVDGKLSESTSYSLQKRSVSSLKVLALLSCLLNWDDYDFSSTTAPGFIAEKIETLKGIIAQINEAVIFLNGILADADAIEALLKHLDGAPDKEKLSKKKFMERVLRNIITNHYIQTLKILLDHDVNVNARYFDSTPLHDAAWGTNLEIVELLLNRGGDINALVDNHALVSRALPDGMASSLLPLLPFGRTPLDNAILHLGKHSQMVQLLRSRGGLTAQEIQDRDERVKKEKEAHLIAFAAIGDIAGVERLLNDGVNSNACNEDGETALWLSARNSYGKMLDFLLKHGADINVKNAQGYTPLMMAVRLGLTKVVTRLLDRGAHINAENAQGNTALMLAALNGAFDLVDLLIVRSADRNYMNHNGERAYDMVARIPGSDIMRELLRPQEIERRPQPFVFGAPSTFNPPRRRQGRDLAREGMHWELGGGLDH